MNRDGSSQSSKWHSKGAVGGLGNRGCGLDSQNYRLHVKGYLTADDGAYIISTLSKNVTSSRGRLNNTVGGKKGKGEE
jgi:hypothetical protein